MYMIRRQNINSWKTRDFDTIDSILIGITSSDEHFQCANGQLRRVHDDHPTVDDKSLARMAADKAFSLLCLGEI